MYIRFEKGKLPMTGEDELKLIGKNARFELSLPETGARELVPRGIAGGRMLADWRRLVVSATSRYLFRLRAETGPVRLELFAPNGRSLLRLQAEPGAEEESCAIELARGSYALSVQSDASDPTAYALLATAAP